MDISKKMQVLSDSAQYDLCDYINHNKTSSPNLPGIYHASGSNGCKIPLFKVLMTNNCTNDCKYCINQSKRNFTRIELNPKELATVFLKYYNNSYVDGLFLSSGIGKEIDSTMEKIIEVARILRKDFGYTDYIHLKIIPGASYDSIKRAMSLANRISLNIEAATSDGLSDISTTKHYQKDIIRRLKWIHSIGKNNPSYSKSGQTTQLIVGANDETDEEILKRIKSLYKQVDLKRSYFSSFSPVEGTEFENKKESDDKRTSQLYHADALLNLYNFNLKELVFNDEGKLSLKEDPKILAAKKNDIFPIEINKASYKELLRVPGIGTNSAKKIIAIRKKKPFKSIEDLNKTGMVVKRAEPYIKIQKKFQTALDYYK